MLTIDENEYELVLLIPKAAKRYTELDEHAKDHYLSMYGKKRVAEGGKIETTVNPNEPVYMTGWNKDIEVYVNGARHSPFRSFELTLDMAETAYAQYSFNRIKPAPVLNPY